MRRALCLLALVCALFALSGKAQAEGVHAVSSISPNYETNVMEGYSAMDIDYDIWVYYSAYTEGYLYEENTLVDARGGPIGMSSEVFTTAPGNPGKTYTQFGDHYLLCFYTYPSCGGYDPYCFSWYGLTEPYPSSHIWAPCFSCQTCCSPSPYIYLGSTIAQAQFLPPQ